MPKDDTEWLGADLNDLEGWQDFHLACSRRDLSPRMTNWSRQQGFA